MSVLRASIALPEPHPPILDWLTRPLPPCSPPGPVGRQSAARAPPTGAAAGSRTAQAGPATRTGQYERPDRRSRRRASAHAAVFDSNHDRFGNVMHGAPSLCAVPGREPTQGRGAQHRSHLWSRLHVGTAHRQGVARRGSGPAYYAPAPQGRKSYHLNARQRWMPAA